MEPITPWVALLGGALLGISTWLLLALNGRIAGISGIVSALLPPAAPGVGWRVLFVCGLAGGAAIHAYLVAPGHDITVAAGWPLVIAGGLLVGIGTRLGAGCTSGHGICGSARLSPRSIVATLTFMLVAFVTVFVTRHLVGGA